jgi:hypothetical protein
MSAKQTPRSQEILQPGRFKWTSRGNITVDLPALATLSLNELEALQNAKDAASITSIADTEGKAAMRSLPSWNFRHDPRLDQ